MGDKEGRKGGGKEEEKRERNIFSVYIYIYMISVLDPWCLIVEII